MATGLKAESDNKASSRKEDHIDMAFQSAVASMQQDNRFNYEPMLSAHPKDAEKMSTHFLDRRLDFPLMVSSMTGGTEKAQTINKNLARACGEFGLAMGLGSCRQLLYEDKRFHEFDVRELMPDQALMMNLGIAQIEEMIDRDELDRITALNSKLQSDALIVHVNPLQEWLQPEGDRINRPAIESVAVLLDKLDIPIIVKEVGQGFGPESIRQLLQMPIAALDLAGFGGTNFSKLELMRSDEVRYDSYSHLYKIGHSCYEMVEVINRFFEEEGEKLACHQIIFSGGIRSFLDGYYLINKSTIPAIYAQASAFLKHAMDYDQLKKFVHLQTEGLKMSKAFLRIKT